MNQNNKDRMRLRDKRTLILGVILVAWIILLWKQSSPSGPAASSEKSTSVKEAQTAHDPELLAWKLNEKMPSIPSEKRNIFAFYDAPPPQPVIQEDQQVAEMEEPQAICGNQACEAGEDFQNCPTDCQPPPPPPPPPITLRYIGYMAEQKDTVAFLTDGKNVFMGRVNDIIANKYRILKITEEQIELGYLNMDQSSTIRFQGNQGG